MSLRRLLRLFTSVKTTAVLLAVLAVLLFLNVVVPQESLLGAEEFAALVGQGGWNRFFLVTLGLGRLSTSPVFIAVLAVFYLNLALVLAGRLRPTLAKLKVRRRSEAGLVAWSGTEGALQAPLPPEWSAAHVVDTLRGYGYRVERVGERVFWGLKHRTAALGFLLFHLSFFLLFGGGLLLYLTRFVGDAVATEGQELSTESTSVRRMPLLGGVPRLRLQVEEVTPRLEQGEPVYLGVRFRFLPSGVEQEARINHPAEWGPVKVLVAKAGVTAVLWLQDGRGFTLDRVAVPVDVRPDVPAVVPVDDGRYLVSIDSVPIGPSFPHREDLPGRPITVSVVRQGDREVGTPAETAFEGTLRPGESASLGGDRLELVELRYWVSVQVVSERGGGVLIAGFVVGVLGLVWRLMLYRREVAVVWDGETLRLVGHSEYFPERFRDELEAIWGTFRQLPG